MNGAAVDGGRQFDNGGIFPVCLELSLRFAVLRAVKDVFSSPAAKR